MKKLNQKGLGLLVLLLILLLILVLGGVGWWVWKQQSNKKSANNSSQSQQAETKEEKKAEEKPAQTGQKYLEIKELGVKVELDDATADAYYIMKNGYAYISLNSLKNIDDCAADKTGIVAVSKSPKAEEDQMYGKTYEQIIQDGGSGTVIGDNAYLVTRSQAYCSENVDTQAKQQAAWNSFIAKAKNMQAL